jgi:hypothetical protein
MTNPSKVISNPIIDTPTQQEDRNRWRWGFVAALLTELATNQGFIHYWNLVQTVTTPVQ